MITLLVIFAVTYVRCVWLFLNNKETATSCALLRFMSIVLAFVACVLIEKYLP